MNFHRENKWYGFVSDYTGKCGFLSQREPTYIDRAWNVSVKMRRDKRHNNTTEITSKENVYYLIFYYIRDNN